MIHVIASITVRESQRESFLEIFKENTDISIKDTEVSRVTVIEKWESFPHLESHFTAPHMLDYKARVEGMVENVSLKILEEA